MKLFTFTLSTTILVGSLVGSTVFSSIAQAKIAPAFSDTDESSLVILPAVEGFGETIMTTETRYIPMEYPTRNFLKATIQTVRYSGAEGGNGSVLLTMLTDGTRRLDKVLWTAAVEGEKVEVLNNELIAVTNYGCCGASDTVRLLNIGTGKKVEAAVGKVFEVEVPNAPALGKRYLSLAVDSKAPSDVNGRKYVGTFSYYNANQIMSRARVYADLPSGWGANFEDLKVIGISKATISEGTRVTLWGSDGVTNPVAAFSGFKLEAKIYYAGKTETVQIVIDRDTIATSSKTSAGLTLVQ